MKYSALFLRAFEYTLQNEGGYVDDPNDSGGKTKFGISMNFLKSSFKNGSIYADIDHNGTINDNDIYVLNEDHAKQLYFLEFWKKVEKIPHDVLAIKVFDAAVNIGLAKAIKPLQRLLNVKADGIVGPKTIQAIRTNNVNKILQQYIDLLKTYYYKVAFWNKPKSEKFLKGWLKRASRIP